MSCDEAKSVTITVESNSRVNATLIAEKVIVEEEARVDNIIADEVELGARARVLKVQAKELNADPTAKYKLAE